MILTCIFCYRFCDEVVKVCSYFIQMAIQGLCERKRNYIISTVAFLHSSCAIEHDRVIDISFNLCVREIVLYNGHNGYIVCTQGRGLILLLIYTQIMQVQKCITYVIFTSHSISNNNKF